MPLECRYRKMPMQPYLRATLADQDRIAGRDMFETFPDNPGVSDIDIPHALGFQIVEDKM